MHHAEKNLIIMVLVVAVIVAFGYGVEKYNLLEKLFPDVKVLTPFSDIKTTVESKVESLISTSSTQSETTKSQPKSSGNNSSSGSTQTYWQNPTSGVVTSTETATTSHYFHMIRISKGNAGSERSNPNKEYIILKANSKNKSSIVISGWSLKNGKDKKYYPLGNTTFLGKSDVVKIPLGTKLLYGDRPSTLSPISLDPGATAYVSSGQIPLSSPVNIDASFLVNKCSGYIETILDYNFAPSLKTSCPIYTDMRDAGTLTEACYNYAKRIGRCHTPIIKRDDFGNEKVDGKTPPEGCLDFVRNNYNYGACLEEFSNDSNFYGHEWRIFLHTGIMWSRTRETITLLDDRGKIVDELSY